MSLKVKWWEKPETITVFQLARTDTEGEVRSLFREFDLAVDSLNPQDRDRYFSNGGSAQGSIQRGKKQMFFFFSRARGDSEEVRSLAKLAFNTLRSRIG